MCTLSWCFSASERAVVFNRDEQRSRSPGLPARIWGEDERSFLAPLDPDGGGTWIGVNDAGLVVALLNYYPRNSDDRGVPRSRGLLVTDLLRAADDVAGVDAALDGAELERYRGFLLFALGAQGEPVLWRWDGARRKALATGEQMVSTSSVRPKTCERYRRRIFDKAGDMDGRRAAHWHYCEKDPSLGPLVRREDARTQSVVSLRVRPESAELIYTTVVDAEPPSAGLGFRERMSFGGA